MIGPLSNATARLSALISVGGALSPLSAAGSSSRRELLPALFFVGLLIAGCGNPLAPRADRFSRGDPARGAQLLDAYGCGACHQIPGIPGATTMVGPPLKNWSERYYIAGSLVNTPENMVRWLQFPDEIEPDTAMPNLGVSETDAWDMSAYLYTLGR